MDHTKPSEPNERFTNSSAAFYGFNASVNTPYVLEFYLTGELKINDTLTTTSLYSINVI